MTSWAWWLVLGLLIGWVIEWIIDWIYWRRRIVEVSETGRTDGERYQAELKTLRAADQKSQANISTWTFADFREKRLCEYMFSWVKQGFLAS